MRQPSAVRRAAGIGLALRRAAIASAMLAPAAIATEAHAQFADRDTSIQNLPRPGYEPREIRIGGTILSPEMELGAFYDSNVFATSTAEEDDIVFRIAPTVRVRRDTGKLRLRADGHLSLLRYLDHGNENTEAFGAGANARYELDATKVVGTTFRYDRTFQPRTDPEADDLSRPPSKIDVFYGEYNFDYRPGRIGVSGTVSASKVNFLPAEEDDRDLSTYRSSIRGSYRLSGRLDVFAEAYANRRDARTAVDRSGVDRDTTTWGIAAGTRVDVADRLQGELAIGFFRAMPDDPATASFSGLSANGRLTWRPRVRTAITAEVFNGDVATVRQGANGRVDTRFSLRIDQEVRHNFILRAGAALRSTSYRGSINRNQTNLGGELGGEYLLSRYASITFNLSYTDRSADQPADEFSKVQAGMGVKLRF